MDVGICGHECIFQLKTNSADYPKSFIEDALVDAPRGVHIVHQMNFRLQPLDIDKVKRLPFFVCTRNARSNNVKGAEYAMKYAESYGNICTFSRSDCKVLCIK